MSEIQKLYVVWQLKKRENNSFGNFWSAYHPFINNFLYNFLSIETSRFTDLDLIPLFTLIRRVCVCLVMLIRTHARIKCSAVLGLKKWQFLDGNLWSFFFTLAQNTDCWNMLEPVKQVTTIYVFEKKNKKRNVYACKPQFYYMHRVVKLVYITRTY